VELSQYDQLKKIVDVNAEANLDRFEPVTARVISQTPSLFYSEIKIDKGSSEGIALGQPVTGGGGLVGRVSASPATRRRSP
jgi:rod shape-determining protein MreC